MKREILVKIWPNLADGDRKEAKNGKRVFKWCPKGANIHESQENSWVAGGRQGTKVDYWPTICEVKKQERWKSKKIDKKQLKLRASTKLEFLRYDVSGKREYCVHIQQVYHEYASSHPSQSSKYTSDHLATLFVLFNDFIFDLVCWTSRNWDDVQSSRWYISLMEDIKSWIVIVPFAYCSLQNRQYSRIEYLGIGSAEYTN